MKNIKVSFDTWIQLLGMLGVLGGLIFVGLEMQQTQTIALASQMQSRSDAIMDFLLAPLEGSYKVAELTQQREVQYSQLEGEGQVMFGQILAWRIVSLNNAYQQHTLGLLPESAFEQARTRSVSMYEDCAIRPIYNRWATPDFLSFLEANSDAECD
tara:strand:- start:65 stop:532 length:468 start_codon:yes stop_codon:yes gene_type:complete